MKVYQLSLDCRRCQWVFSHRLLIFRKAFHTVCWWTSCDTWKWWTINIKKLEVNVRFIISWKYLKCVSLQTSTLKAEYFTHHLSRQCSALEPHYSAHDSWCCGETIQAEFHCRAAISILDYHIKHIHFTLKTDRWPNHISCSTPDAQSKMFWWTGFGQAALWLRRGCGWSCRKKSTSDIAVRWSDTGWILGEDDLYHLLIYLFYNSFQFDKWCIMQPSKGGSFKI